MLKTTLYLGLRPPLRRNKNTIHYPIICVEAFPRSKPCIQEALTIFEDVTHLIFTSQSAVQYFTEIIEQPCPNKTIIAVGKATAKECLRLGWSSPDIATNETAEGVVSLLKDYLDPNFVFLWPRSDLARPVILEYFDSGAQRFSDCPIYTVKAKLPGPLADLSAIDEIFFTSPSTVEAFIHFFGSIPTDKKLTCIGPITEKALDKYLSSESTDSDSDTKKIEKK
jgi:uroporphyrinogen-III synthase